MQCIFDYCKDDLSGDILVVAFYGALVTLTLGLSFLARSRSIRNAAGLIAGAWVFSIVAFFYVKVPAYYLVSVVLDAVLAFHFWRIAKTQIFPATLCVILLVEIAFVVFALSAGVSTFWTLFVMNRLFEVTLLYLIGCALFRMHIRRQARKSAAPITGWRANFVVG